MRRIKIFIDNTIIPVITPEILRKLVEGLR